MPVIHLIIVCLLPGFQFALFQMGLHAEWVDEPHEFTPKMLSERFFIISTAAYIISRPEEARISVEREQTQPQEQMLMDYSVSGEMYGGRQVKNALQRAKTFP